MSTALSVAEILAKLEARIVHHEQQMAFHKQQEIHHSEQSAAHEAELAKVRQHFEAFQAAALPAADLAGVPVAAVEAGDETQEDYRDFVGKRIMISKLIARVVHRLEEETFGATRVAQETNRRHRDKLKKPVDVRQVSVVLRRLRDAGQLHQLKPGGAAHEALYSKRRPA
jgi:hypothetical protein